MAGNALDIKSGGTSQTTAPGARIALGLEPGVDVQPFDADLTAIAALGGTGFATRTAADTWALRTFTGTANEIAITNGAGVAGNPVLSLPNGLVFTGKTITGGIYDSAQFNGSIGLTTPSTGAFTTLSASGAFSLIGDDVQISEGGTGASDAATARDNLGLEIGVDIQAFDSDLAALATNVTNGLWARTGAGTGAARTITGTANEITLVNGDGVGGNPVISIPTALTFTGKTVTGGTFNSIFNGTLGATTPNTISATTGVFSGLLTVNANIQFPSTQVPNAGANVLDDYEEDTWTPTFTVGGSGTGVTYTTQIGRYTKIGRLVTIEGELVLSNNGSNTGNCAIGSLPFTVGIDHAASVIAGNSGGFSGLTAGITGEFSGGTSTITLRASTTTGGAVLQDTQVGNTARFLIGGSYSV